MAAALATHQITQATNKTVRNTTIEDSICLIYDASNLHTQAAKATNRVISSECRTVSWSSSTMLQYSIVVIASLT